MAYYEFCTKFDLVAWSSGRHAAHTHFWNFRTITDIVEREEYRLGSRRSSSAIELGTTTSKSTATKYNHSSFIVDDREAGSSKSTEIQSDSKKYKAWLLWWNTEEWWSCWIGLIFFGCVVSAVHHDIPEPSFLTWTYNPFLTFASTGNYCLIILFFAMGIMLWICMGAVQAAGWQQFPLGYLVVFFIALISKILASNAQLKQASLGASIWAIIIGFVARNVLDVIKAGRPLPAFLKAALQTELYIAISLVLLCIDISVLRPLAPRALFVSWLDTPSLFMVVAFLGWRILKIDRQTAIILSGATFICGSSAAIALGASMGCPYKTQMPIAIISIFTIPSIIALPYVAHRLGLSPTVSGAWFGGCVDSTGGVIASASIYGDKEAIDTSAIVKMMQNVLIGPISVIMAWGWSKYELKQRDDEGLLRSNGRQEKAYVLLWKRFPKFVLGFIITAMLFNTVVGGDSDQRQRVNDFCFYVSEWFSTLSFVSIGLGLQLNEMKQNIRNLGKLCTLYIVAQMIDIVITAVLAWIAFTYM